jgi:hypothetical protein
MFTTHRRRSTSICTLVCVALMATFTAAAIAAPTAEERYYRSFEESPAQAQAAYYSSYGNPDPLSAPQSPAPSDDTPWLAIAASIAGAILIAGAGATQVHRVRIRRRRMARPAL